MNIDVQYPEIDIDEWRKVYDEFSEPARGTAKWEGLFPDVRQLRLESTLIRLNGVRLDKATFTVRPIQTAAGSESWRVDLSSRSEEHTSELQSLMRISYAVLCLKKKTKKQ